MTDHSMPALPEHLMIFDQSDDDSFGSLTEKSWDTDYSMKVGDPMFTADQTRDYAKAYAAPLLKRIASLEAKLKELEAERKSIFDTTPQVTHVSFGPEPSLRTVIKDYYRYSGVHEQTAVEMTNDYITALSTKEKP